MNGKAVVIPPGLVEHEGRHLLLKGPGAGGGAVVGERGAFRHGIQVAHRHASESRSLARNRASRCQRNNAARSPWLMNSCQGVTRSPAAR